MLVLYPYFLVKIAHKAGQASSWLDNKIFPPTNYTREQELKLLWDSQAKTEQAALYVQKVIDGCKTLEQTYGATDLVANFKGLYGRTTQGSSWVDSLHLRLYNLQKSIINNL